MAFSARQLNKMQPNCRKCALQDGRKYFFPVQWPFSHILILGIRTIQKLFQLFVPSPVVIIFPSFAGVLAIEGMLIVME